MRTAQLNCLPLPLLMAIYQHLLPFTGSVQCLLNHSFQSNPLQHNTSPDLVAFLAAVCSPSRPRAATRPRAKWKRHLMSIPRRFLGSILTLIAANRPWAQPGARAAPFFPGISPPCQAARCTPRFPWVQSQGPGARGRARHGRDSSTSPV